MIPYDYGFGFEPNGYPQIDLQIDLQIDFKRLGRNCKALVKKARRSASRRQQKR